MRKKSGLEHSALEKRRGFLIYMGMTYPLLVPYFKGIHSTLYSWRENRDAEGWRIRNYCVTRKISSPISLPVKLGKEVIGVEVLSEEEVNEEEKEDDEEWEDSESRSLEKPVLSPTKTYNAPERVQGYKVVR